MTQQGTADTDPADEPHGVDAVNRGLVSSLDRRSVLKGFAIAGVGAAVPLLAGCGGSDGGAADANTKKTPPTPGNSGSGGTKQAPGATVLVAAADVPVDGGVILQKQGYVVTQPSKGTFEGFTSTCTHMGCPLNNVSGGTINCICHGSRFSIEDGSVVNGPATQPLPKKPVKVEGTNVVEA